MQDWPQASECIAAAVNEHELRLGVAIEVSQLFEILSLHRAYLLYVHPSIAQVKEVHTLFELALDLIQALTEVT